MSGHEHEELRRDLAASVEARRELGPAYEDELVQAFVERLDARIADRVAARVDREQPDSDAGVQQFVLGLVSLGTGIPITAIASSNGGTSGTVVSWLGIVGVNAAYAWSRRR